MNARLAREVYPGWVMRVYHNLDLNSPAWRTAVCNITCTYDHVDFCDVRRLPGLGDLSHKFGMVWRFAVLADETVRRFLVRDLDSMLGRRERDAVDAWLASNLTFHVMRDNPEHGTSIMAGMWGGRNWHNAVYRPILSKMLNATQSLAKHTDQAVLDMFLWPEILKRKDVMAHDSYLCTQYPLSRPFPTQRCDPGEFVGRALLQDRMKAKLKPLKPLKECPPACRPAEHQDWLRC